LESPSPARLYASLVGGALALLGIAGFFYSASFASPGTSGEMFGAFAVNGWSNLLHVASGAIGLAVIGAGARRYALWLGWAYVALAIWGFLLDGGSAILGFLPANSGDNLLHLALGLLGLAAALATPAPSRAKRRLPRRPRPKTKRRPPRRRAPAT
jgi:hypothetical protein